MTDIHTLIHSINKNSGLEYILEKKIGRSCYLISPSNTEEKKVLKYSPPVTNKKHALWRFVMGGSLPFQNEFRVLSEIANHTDLKFNTPKVSKFENNSFYIAGYVKSNRSVKLQTLNNDEREKISLALFGIRTLNRPSKWMFLKEQIFRYLESPTRRIITDILKAGKSNKIKSRKITGLVLKLEIFRFFKIKRVLPGIIHNDMGINNVIFDQSQNIYFIDWEDALWEKKWPLLDVADLALNIDNGELDKILVNNYIKHFIRSNADIQDDLLKCHITYSYIRAMLRALNLKRVKHNQKIQIAKKLNDFVSNPEIQNSWWETVRNAEI
jgi:thiamine kinase-like enzyme